MFYIKNKETSEYQLYGYEDGWYDEEDDFIYGEYFYLIGESLEYATEFDTHQEAIDAIVSTECNLDNYEIMEVING